MLTLALTFILMLQDVPARPQIEITPIEASPSETEIVVTSHDVEADDLLVRTCWYYKMEGIAEELVKCHDEIAPVVDGAMVVADTAPVALPKVYSVIVRPIKYNREEFRIVRDEP